MTDLQSIGPRQYGFEIGLRGVASHVGDGAALRVLRVVPTIEPTAGGPSSSAVNAAIAEALAGLDTTLIATFDPSSQTPTDPACRRLIGAGVRVILFPHSGLLGRRTGFWGASMRLIGWILRNVPRFDLVHLHYVWTLTTLTGSVRARVAGVPVVLTGHESLTAYDIDVTSGSRLKQALKLLLRRVIMKQIAAVVCASELELRDSIRSGEHGIVVSHPVAPTGPDFEVRKTDRHEGFTLGYLGRLHPKKRVDDLLRAVAAEDEVDRLIVCGVGEAAERERLRRLERELGIEDRIEWRGHVTGDGKRRLFAESDWLAMPSEFESFGMSAAEALAAGVPVIVTDRTGIAPLVERYECGTVVAVDDDGGLAAAIVAAAKTEPAARDRLHRNALLATRSALTFGAYASRIAGLYRSLIYPAAR